MKSVILVDDHPLFRGGTRDTLNTIGGFEIIGDFSTGEDAIQSIRHRSPDFLIVDISLPGISGFDLLQQALAIDASIQCIVLTMHESNAYAERAKQLGAKGFLVKTDKNELLRDCIDTIISGDYYLSPSLIRKATSPNKTIDVTYGINQREIDNEENIFDRLSKREKTVMLLIAEGKTSKHISHELHLSLRTVQNHRSNIAKKLQLHGSNALLKFAIENETSLRSAVKRESNSP